MPKPGETVLGGPFRMGPGGKGGNQAVAAARQGSQVYMVTKVGEDQFGSDALQNFTKEKIDTSYV
ncbi:PfkB family carbohydrate kinase, partial [Microbacteriaceae bacterium K1510]|nr:PfkB family carbohydrate kinase [Microbacteriaceae bacterium K1510]